MGDPDIRLGWGQFAPIVSSIGYLRQEKKVRIETNLYLISHLDGILVRTGVIDTPSEECSQRDARACSPDRSNKCDEGILQPAPVQAPRLTAKH